MSGKESYQDIRPTVWIGKHGVTSATAEEIRRQVKERRIIKIRWLRNTEVNPEEIAMKTNTQLLQVRGRTMIVGKK